MFEMIITTPNNGSRQILNIASLLDKMRNVSGRAVAFDVSVTSNGTDIRYRIRQITVRDAEEAIALLGDKYCIKIEFIRTV